MEGVSQVCDAPFFIFFLFTDTKSLKNIFIYNKAQTFTSSGFVFPQKSISLQKTS